MENETLMLLRKMNEKLDKRFGQLELRLDQHERLLQSLITMTAKTLKTSMHFERN